MTRPMPGPPQWLESFGLGDWDADGRWRNRWDLHWEDGRAEYNVAERHDKRLTDAECAAEFWRATSETTTAALNHCPECPGCQAIVDEELTWHRFATRPQALEANP